MIEPAAASKERHDRFVKRVVSSGEVWGLKSEDGWACTASTTDGTENRDVTPFWSDRAYAGQCAKDDWYIMSRRLFPLQLFLGEWLPGMEAEGSLVGTNWNVHLCGFEIEPTDLKQQIEGALEDRISSTVRTLLAIFFPGFLSRLFQRTAVLRRCRTTVEDG